MRFSIERMLTDVLASRVMLGADDQHARISIMKGGWVDNDYNQLVLEVGSGLVSVVATDKGYSVLIDDTDVDDPVIWEDSFSEHDRLVGNVVEIIDDFIRLGGRVR